MVFFVTLLFPYALIELQFLGDRVFGNELGELSDPSSLSQQLHLYHDSFFKRAGYRPDQIKLDNTSFEVTKAIACEKMRQSTRTSRRLATMSWPE
ncbi:hypothetical protein V8C42DRAFT_310900 [Trichoderma barbatum]